MKFNESFENLKRTTKKIALVGSVVASMASSDNFNSDNSRLEDSEDYSNSTGNENKERLDYIISMSHNNYVDAIIMAESENIDISLNLVGKSKEICNDIEKDYYTFLNNALLFKDIPGLNLSQEISKAAEKEPEVFLRVFFDLQYEIEQSESLILLEKAFAISPDGFFYYEGYKHFFENKETSSFKVINFLKNIKNSNSVVLLHSMFNDNLSEEDAIKIIGNESIFFRKLIEINSIPNHLGKIAVDKNLKDISLNIVQRINSLHESSDLIRFDIVESFDVIELYSLMVYGGKEIFTSSFNGLFNRLKLKLDKKNGGISGQMLINKVGKDKIRVFISQCSGFNRLDEFLSTMDRIDADRLLIDIIKNIETSEDKLSKSSVVSEIFGNIEDMERLKILQKQIKIEYERIENNKSSKKEDLIIYGLLSQMFKNDALVEKEWYKSMSSKYYLNKITELKLKDLFNKNGVCVQKYYFFEDGDGDGLSSFNNFIKSYKNDSKWEVNRNNKDFVIITGKNQDKIIEIYANIPKTGTSGIAGIEEMDKFMEDKKLKINVYTYRGHSFGFQISGDISNASLVNIGSCGGYKNISYILNESPNANIISTQGTGSKDINDPIFLNLNNLILSGKDIIWKDYWEKLPLSIRNNKNFKDYVPPYKNQGAMFIRAYNEIKNKN